MLIYRLQYLWVACIRMLVKDFKHQKKKMKASNLEDKNLFCSTSFINFKVLTISSSKLPRNFVFAAINH